MSNPDQSYASLMDQGEAAMNTDRMLDAIDVYNAAARAAADNTEQAQAVQLASIALSVSGQLQEAEALNAVALGLADGDPILTARILRDSAMVTLRIASRSRNTSSKQAFVRLASATLNQSIALLRGSEHQVERTISLSYRGRYQLLFGESQDAALILRLADETLCSSNNRTYELNNLMWLLRAVPRKERSELRNRIMPLIAQTGQTRRYNQIPLIMLGGNRLYTFVEQRAWVQALIIKIITRIKRS